MTWDFLFKELQERIAENYKRNRSSLIEGSLNSKQNVSFTFTEVIFFSSQLCAVWQQSVSRFLSWSTNKANETFKRLEEI